jgi:hypothetical protein
LTGFFLGDILKFVGELTKTNNYKYNPVTNLDKDTTHTVQTKQYDNNDYEFVENLNKNTIDTITLRDVLITVCFIVLTIVRIRSYDTWQPSNAIFVNKVDKTSSETKMEGLDNIFPSGHWVSSYFQYEQWHGPYTFSLSFNHHELKVTGSGIDEVGAFSIDGIYSLNTGRIGLTKIYQKGTGNQSENLGHKVIIQLEWNFEKHQFEGEWYVHTNKYHGKDKFTLKFDQETTIVDEFYDIENC